MPKGPLATCRSYLAFNVGVELTGTMVPLLSLSNFSILLFPKALF